jgi:hypothetical protein
MKSILKNMLVGVLLITGTTKPAPFDDVKDALLKSIPEGEVNDKTIIECVGGISDFAQNTNATWLCFAINQLLNDKKSTEKYTASASLGGWLPYVKTLSASVENNTVKKLVIINDNASNVVCGITFTIANKKCTAAYIDKDATEQLLTKSSLDTARGFTNFYQVPTAYRGPLYTVGKISLGVLGLYLAGKMINAYATHRVDQAVEAVMKKYNIAVPAAQAAIASPSFFSSPFAWVMSGIGISPK